MKPQLVRLLVLLLVTKLIRSFQDFPYRFVDSGVDSGVGGVVSDTIMK